jgi:hypothetical protein
MNHTELNTRKMPIGAGKTEFTLARLQELSDPSESFDGMLIFGRPWLESGDTKSVLAQLGPHAPPSALRAMAGSTLLTLDGYAEEEAEIYEIRAVRDYFQGITAKWSPWLFAGSTQSDDLFAIVLACLPSVACVRTDDEVYVQWQEHDMRAFLHKGIRHAAWLLNRASIGEAEGRTMLLTAASYLGIPFSEDQ